MIRHAAAALLFIVPTYAMAECAPTHVDLRGDWGQARFNVEVADDRAERAQGLMFRETLDRRSGMLFVYEEPQRVSFWMKNTLIPLDMLFVDETGQVQRIHENATPGDVTSIDGGDDILFVLEINGGLASRLGIDETTVLRHSALDPDKMIWSCDDG